MEKLDPPLWPSHEVQSHPNLLEVASMKPGDFDTETKGLERGVEGFSRRMESHPETERSFDSLGFSQGLGVNWVQIHNKVRHTKRYVRALEEGSVWRAHLILCDVTKVGRIEYSDSRVGPCRSLAPQQWPDVRIFPAARTAKVFYSWTSEGGIEGVMGVEGSSSS
jgi:hypothetical protein